MNPAIKVIFILFFPHTIINLFYSDLRKLERDFKEFPSQKVVESNCLDCGPFANERLRRSGRWSLEKLTALVVLFSYYFVLFCCNLMSKIRIDRNVSMHIQLRKKIDKNPEVRRRKWHVQPLSDAQKIYAATDAYVRIN